MKILVLGSHGTVGKSVCDVFSKNNHIVIPWDIKIGPEFDLRIPNNLDEIIKDIDFIIFLAFDVGGAKYNVNSSEYIDDNIQIIYNTFASIKKFNKPCIYTTSTMSNMNNNPYSVLKRLSEFYTTFSGGINVKLWNVYGNETVCDKSHVIPDIIDKAIKYRKIELLTSGSEDRMFLYSYDCAEAIYCVYSNFSALKGNDMIDISSESWISILDIAKIVKNTVENITNNIVEISTSNLNADSHTCKNHPNLSVIKQFWSPKVSIRAGIEMMVNDAILSLNK